MKHIGYFSWLTWKNIIKLCKFFNIVDRRTGALSAPKVLAWAVAAGIIAVLFKLNDSNLDLTVFAGCITTLVAAFATAYKISQGKKDKDDSNG